MTVCDVCNNETNWESSYILTSTQVTTSEAYWEKTFKGIWSYIHSMDPIGDSLGMLVQQQAGQSSGWMVCESCSSLFSFDKFRAREHAQAHNGTPPGVGPAPTEAASRAAAQAWHRLYSTWPSSLKFREPASVPTPVETPPIHTSVTAISEQVCWYCQTKRTADGLPFKVVLFKMDGKNRSEHHVYVPRCSSCQAIHKKQAPYINRIVPIVVVGSMALCPVVGFAGAKPLGGWSWALGVGIWLAVTGIVLGITVLLTKGAGTKTESSPFSEVSEVKKMKSEGWSVDPAKSLTLLSRKIGANEGKILCKKCYKPIFTVAEVRNKYSDYQEPGDLLVMSSMDTFFQREADKNAIGVTCAVCGHHFCVECMNKHGKAHPTSGGMSCLDCGGRMKDFARPFIG